MLDALHYNKAEMQTITLHKDGYFNSETFVLAEFYPVAQCNNNLTYLRTTVLQENVSTSADSSVLMSQNGQHRMPRTN